jgi:drug/metabolite transporter (DMT)-like permease
VFIETPQGRAPRRWLIVSCVGLVVAIWAVNFIAAKIGLRYLPTLTMSSFRVVFAALAMVPTYLLCSRLPAFAEAVRIRERGLSPKDLWTFFYLGFFGVAINQMCFTIGLSYTSVSHAAVIVGLQPVYTLALAVLLRIETATPQRVLGMGIALAGVAILASEKGISSHSPSLLGDAITMAGSLGFAMYAVLGKKIAGRYDALTMTAFNHFAGALIAMPIALHQTIRLTSSLRHDPVPWSAWGALLYMAVFSSAVAYVLYFWLLRYLQASQLAAFTYLLPVLATLLGILWLGERGSPLQILGGVLALGGVYRVESARESKTARQA